MSTIMLLESKNYLFALITVFILNGCTDRQTDSLSGSKPNIVFVLADDMGWDKHYPEYQGFDKVSVYQGGGIFNYASRLSQPFEEVSGKVLSEALTDLSLKFIEKNRETPFFLFLAHFWLEEWRIDCKAEFPEPNPDRN